MSWIKHVFGAICYWTGVDALFYLLNRGKVRTVTFHSVIPDDMCEGMKSLPVAYSASTFRWMIREARRFLGGSLAVTFDDGYLNQYEIVPRILAEEGIQTATIFVAGDVLDSKGRDTALPPDRLNHEGLCFSAEYERLRLSGMTLAQIEDLRSRGWKMGYHTKSHRQLLSLSLEEKKDELRPPAWLKDKILSYPFGKPWDVDEESIRIAEEYGYECAYSNQCENDGHHERWFLPRMVLVPDKYWIHLELSGAKYFFKYCRLLPRL